MIDIPIILFLVSTCGVSLALAPPFLRPVQTVPAFVRTAEAKETETVPDCWQTQPRLRESNSKQSLKLQLALSDVALPWSQLTLT